MCIRDSFYDLLAISTVAITAFSTTAFEACVANVPTLAYVGDLDQTLPLRHVMSDMPHFAQESKEIVTVLSEMLSGGPALDAWRSRRDNFVARNPQILDGNTANHLARLMSA